MANPPPLPGTPPGTPTRTFALPPSGSLETVQQQAAARVERAAYQAQQAASAAQQPLTRLQQLKGGFQSLRQQTSAYTATVRWTDPATALTILGIGLLLLITGAVNWSLWNKLSTTSPASVRGFSIATTIVGALLIIVGGGLFAVGVYTSKGKAGLSLLGK